MNRARFLNRYRNGNTEEARSAYKRQKNFCVKLLRNLKMEFGNNLSVKYFNILTVRNTLQKYQNHSSVNHIQKKRSTGRTVDIFV